MNNRPGQPRRGGNQRAHSRRNSHGDNQDVIEHQRRRREQAGEDAQVLGGHRVRAAASGIRRNRLPVGKVDDDQQHDNREADRNDVAHASRAERNQQRESGFRSVRRRAEGVQTEDGNPGADADLLAPLVLGSDRLA